LHNRNYRLFALGQMVSIVGTWMQDVAQAWYVLLLGMILSMRKVEFREVVRTPKARVRDAWHHVMENADVRAGLLSLAFIGTFAYNTSTIFPMMARFLFAGEIGAAAQLLTAAGIGAIISGLAMARMGIPTRRQV
jgi:hypothetical protein